MDHTSLSTGFPFSIKSINLLTFSISYLTLKNPQGLHSFVSSFLINNLSKTGGHLASNLGVVELTISLLNSFNLPNDKIVWDVGHQSYVHKILNGRKEELKVLLNIK